MGEVVFVSSKQCLSGFSVDDLAKAENFYGKVLGLAVKNGAMGLELVLPGGAKSLCTKKATTRPRRSPFSIFRCPTIDQAVDELSKRGVVFEHYSGAIGTDAKGIARGRLTNRGPDIAWFKDPAETICRFFKVKAPMMTRSLSDLGA